MTEGYSPEPRRRGRPPKVRQDEQGAPQTGETPVVQAAAQEAAPPRSQAAETRQRRRRRDDFGETRNLKLAVPENLKDPAYEYRWINDTDGGRVHQMTVLDDWDIVQTKDIDGQGEGTAVARIAGTTESNKPQRVYLVRKRKEFYEEDQRAKRERLNEVEKDIQRGPLPSSGLSSSEAYVPAGHTNVIGRGS